MRNFRKYHRFLAPLLAVPLALTVLTGMLVTLTQEWPMNTGLSSNLLLQIHTGEIVGLQAIYPLLNGVGVIGLLATGVSLLRASRRKQPPSRG